MKIRGGPPLTLVLAALAAANFVATSARADEPDAGAASSSPPPAPSAPVTGADDAAPATPGSTATPVAPTAAEGAATPAAPAADGAGAAAAPPADPAAFAAPPAEPAGASSGDVTLNIKVYGDTGYVIRNNVDQIPANPNVYSPGVWNSFSAPRVEFFITADWEKLSFLSEILLDADNNNFGIDAERLQLAYVFSNWLRVTAGRKHLAWGYYNDSYHHGNLFELTTSRPYSVNFEDSGGIILSHNVGVAIDGTFDADSAGSFRYDAEVGNGRNSDVTAVAMQFSEKSEKMVNLRLRWLTPIDGLIVGVNGMRDVVPGLPAPSATGAARANAEELVGGAHVVYNEHGAHVDVEAFTMRHNIDGQASTAISGAFAELGYSIGAFTPYVRPEYIAFPSSGDPIYQWSADSAQGAISGNQSLFYGVRDFTDLRVGVKWLPIPQLALKLEGERLGHNSQNQEIATVKAAFGF